MENPPFEGVFPIQDGDFPLLCLFTAGYLLTYLLPAGHPSTQFEKETLKQGSSFRSTNSKRQNA